MKLTSLAAALALGSLATAAHANDHAEPNAQAKAAKFTIDTPIEQLMADEKARAVVVANFDGQDISQHPMYEQFKTMSLKAVAPFAQGMITEEMLANIEAGLSAIN